MGLVASRQDFPRADPLGFIEQKLAGNENIAYALFFLVGSKGNADHDDGMGL
jgi:hypothetical protein